MYFEGKVKTIASDAFKENSYIKFYYPCDVYPSVKPPYDYGARLAEVYPWHPNEEVDAAVAPTYTKTGLTQGSHCAVCQDVLLQGQGL